MPPLNVLMPVSVSAVVVELVLIVRDPVPEITPLKVWSGMAPPVPQVKALLFRIAPEYVPEVPRPLPRVNPPRVIVVVPE